MSSERPNEQPPRTLFVSTFFSDSAGRRTPAHDITKQLELSGWPTITVSRHPRRLPRALDILMTIWRERKAYNVAVMDVFSGKAFALCEAAGELLHVLRKPQILNLQGGGLVRFAERWPARVRRVLGRAAAVVAPSDFIAQSLRSIRSDIDVIPNGIRISDYPFRLRGPARPHLVWVRGFHATYAPWIAVEVVERLRHLGHEPRLTMVGADVGDGSLGRVRSQIDLASIGKYVDIVGPVAKSDVPHWLSESDIFLNTTTLESFGIAMVEAMACGLCVVSTDVGGVPFVVSHGEDGLLVPVNDAISMADAVDALVRDPELSARLSRQARTTAESFDWQKILGRWQTLLRAATQPQR